MEEWNACLTKWVQLLQEIKFGLWIFVGNSLFIGQSSAILKTCFKTCGFRHIFRSIHFYSTNKEDTETVNYKISTLSYMLAQIMKDWHQESRTCWFPCITLLSSTTSSLKMCILVCSLIHSDRWSLSQLIQSARRI